MPFMVNFHGFITSAKITLLVISWGGGGQSSITLQHLSRSTSLNGVDMWVLQHIILLFQCVGQIFEKWCPHSATYFSFVEKKNS